MALIGSLKRRLRTDRRKVAPRAKAWPCQFLMIPMIIAALAGCNPFDRGSSWHQRLVLEVETPDGVVSGGSVVEVRVWKSRVPGQPGIGMGTDITGEASFVEVAPGRYLFALVDSTNPRELALRLFFPEPAPDTFDRAEMLGNMQGESRVVPAELYPLLVTFTDIDDPASVRQVDPNNLANTFGEGVQLRRIMLAVTDHLDAPYKITTVLSWLLSHKGMLDGRTISIMEAEDRLANDLSVLNFRRER
jgi:hypothetical protein